MWVCQKCNQKYSDDNTNTCWKCGTDSPILNRTSKMNEDIDVVTGKRRGPVRYEIIRGTLISWDGLAAKAAEFLAKIPKEKLLGISHSEDKNDGVIIIFYEN